MQIGAILAQLFVCLPVLSSDVCLSTVGLAAKLKRDVLFNAYTHTHMHSMARVKWYFHSLAFLFIHFLFSSVFTVVFDFCTTLLWH